MSAPILRLGLRSLFGRARVWLMVAMPVILVVLAFVLRRASSGDVPADSAEQLLRNFGIGIAVPVVALVATTTLINSEFDDGSIIYLLTKPVSRVSIIASKAVVTLGAGVVFAAVPMLIAGLILSGTADRMALAGLLGGVVASIAYVGVFTALATTMKRSIIGCLLFWLIWESTLASLFSPVKWLSPRTWGNSVIQHVSSGIADTPPVPLWYALAATAVVLVLGVVLAGKRLASMTISEE
ncbi:ABC transporter permease subunit [Flexivirga sp. ID2601S]|uniref:ABC transporter permease subunit n=1 Tax=Flexivirga aerilata TaxID=1656889 RepID=A0A849AKU1_9MICO|nr:ABC transporter permease subunit [Flexivirga aerilata]NNG39010.1 ABC transporter permease subunit [Flexivirga aerilata]